LSRSPAVRILDAAEEASMKHIERMAVIGAGTMGRGIAQVGAGAGLAVALYDVGPGLAERGREGIQAFLNQGIAKGKVSEAERDAVLARIETFGELAPAVVAADLVVEAAPEDLELKRRIFAELDRLAPGTAILATNTSSLPVGEIAGATADPARVIGMHFFNPVPVMALLEIVRPPATGEDTLTAALDVGRRMGKECIVVSDTPGFATSRLGLVLGLEAVRMLEQKVASAEDIDKAMTLGYRHPMGPLRLTDLIGLDVRLAIAEHLYRTLGTAAFEPPALLRAMVAEGKLGMKSGRGFYDWSPAGPGSMMRREV
jgi:3-hydroxybutyryl-CoA dehydrogenase